ncbi:hypothetical protein BS47DRAFT_1369907 [Hydnum rufescens UP504]|uniref:DUF6532 domain-containing protein n=1 Tax=Hydnum rufescens UP504 TaxID=1448309 RepID=A0A9P6AB99_9AGAM|nr:hypothetical protein BS47DRAFT_1369907 [Hydnum rufescens UP504]
MLLDDIQAHFQILQSVHKACDEQGVTHFAVDETFFKLIHEASTFRSCFKTKAQLIVPLLYGFFGKDQATIKAIVDTVLSFQCYCYESFDDHPNMPQQNALHHPAIWSIIKIFFDSSESKVIASEIMLSFSEMLVGTVAFSLTIVHSATSIIILVLIKINSMKIHEALMAWKIGVLDKKSTLTAATYLPIYCSHVLWIDMWRKKPNCTEDWKIISQEMGQEAFVACGYTSDSSNPAMQFMVFDTD